MPNVTETTDALARVGTPYVLRPGQTFQGQVGGAGDHDWVRVDLVAGQQYSFGLVGSGLAPTHLHDPLLTLRNAGGVQVAVNDDVSYPDYAFSGLTYTATATGTYYLDVSGYSGVGQYTLSAAAGDHAHYDVDMGAAALLRPDLSWSPFGSPATVTWGVRQSEIDSVDLQGSPAPFSQLSAAQTAAVQAALTMYSEIANIRFVQVNPGGTTDNAAMLFSNYSSSTDGAGAFASYPGTYDEAGDVHFNVTSVSTSSLPPGSYSHFAVMHEIGHAIGLAHPGPYNAAPGVDITYDDFAVFRQDSNQYTVMSYFGGTETGANYPGNPQSAMLYDIYALQMLYGANMTTRAGNTVYGFNTTEVGTIYDASINTSPAFSIWDAGGIDTVDLSGVSANQVINLNAGSFSNIGGLTANVSIAYGAIIENAIGGSGDDQFIGNSAANVFTGNGGADVVNGNGGTDTFHTGGINGGGWHSFSYGGSHYVMSLRDATDRLVGVERISDGGQMINSASLETFDPLAYGASYNDLAVAFRTNAAAAFRHYLNNGFDEGRETSFSAEQYLANWADLRNAFGNNTAAATQHFLQNGVGEHRIAEDPLDYIASYTDLMSAYRGRSEAQLESLGRSHYLRSGFNEGRRNGIDFDAEQYVDNYADLTSAFGGNLDAATVHYINSGFSEHRLWENPLQYVASFVDLTAAYGNLSFQQMFTSGLKHFQRSGFNEGRRNGIDFDVDAYLANYADLRMAFGNDSGGYDEAAATYHYIANGFDEGRTDMLFA